MNYTPTGCLLNALRRDREKGYGQESGWRSTREIADFCSQPIGSVRRELNRLNQAELISWEKAVDNTGDLWVINEPLKAGDQVKVERILTGTRSEDQEAEVIAILDSEIKVQFEDGHTNKYLAQEIKEIVVGS